ncbi:isopentenyl-diphosphate Delta-isomerase [Vagococcus sp. WN89Y]|uniref:isopentenyl-diphosphate Delta-isomerase n=1 Tax=Vagococcus sp. WN89Y TaxID=3457258 RepID=UPI003FCD291E
MGKQEQIILVNEQGELIGTQEKYAAHTPHTPLHLAFSCWIFNQHGQLLMTRRALSKKAWPGVWTNSVCGHPQPGEATEEAIIRRCFFEIGARISAITPVLPDFRYRATDASGIVENEICPVYAARVHTEIQPNPDEVMETQWIELDDLFRALSAAPWAFSPWIVEEAAGASEQLRQFAARAKQ